MSHYDRKWNYRVHCKRITCSIAHTKTTWNRQRRQVYRVYILVKLGHGLNSDMFIYISIGRSLCSVRTSQFNPLAPIWHDGMGVCSFRCFSKTLITLSNCVLLVFSCISSSMSHKVTCGLKQKLSSPGHLMAHYGSVWDFVAPYGSLWLHLALYGSLWLHMASYGSVWLHIDPYGSLWLPIG